MANPIEYRNGAPSLSGYISSGKKNDAQRESDSRHSATKYVAQRESDSRYSGTKRDAIKGAMQSGAVGAGLRAAAYGAGGLLSGADMTIGDVLGAGISPSTALGMSGNIVNAAFGLPDTRGYKVAGFAAPAIGAAIAGPVGGLLGGAFGGLAYDKVLDAFDARDQEAELDAMEDAYGFFSGYNAREKQYNDMISSLAAQVYDGTFGMGWAQKAEEQAAYDSMISSLAAQVHDGTFGMGGRPGSGGLGMTSREAEARDNARRAYGIGGGDGGGSGGSGGGSKDGVGHGSVGADGKGAGYGGKGAGADRW